MTEESSTRRKHTLVDSPALDEVKTGWQVIASPLGPLTAFPLDIVVAFSPDPGTARLKKLPSGGAEGYRAAWMELRTTEALREPDGYGVARVFGQFVRLPDAAAPVKALDVVVPDAITEYANEFKSVDTLPRSGPSLKTFQPLGYRSKGRPTGKTVVTHTRVWTVECLRSLSGLTVVEALRIWNQWVPENEVAPHTLESTGRRTFYRDLKAVAAELFPALPAPVPRSRGRPRKYIRLGNLMLPIDPSQPIKRI